MNTSSPIAVLGAGAWGTALALLLARNGQTVRLWDHDTARLIMMEETRECLGSLSGVALPENLSIEVVLENAVSGVTDLCLVVPSYAFRAVLMRLKPIVPMNARFIWGTKGLDPATRGFMHDVVFQVFSPKTSVAVLAGPSFAKEVALNLPTAVSLAGNDEVFLNSLTRRFHNGHFRMYQHPDLIGVQLSSVVKNVIAIAVGMSDGMGFGANTRCALITRGLSEMGRLCVALGGLRETMMSLAGVGDLVLTCTDNQSRNRRFGLAVGQGSPIEKALQEVGESVEGYYNTKHLFELAKKYDVIMPIAEEVYAILYENRSPKGLLSELLKREPVLEF